MSVEHTGFFDLAKESLSKNGEIWTRNAISRSYYAMYHSALRVTNKMIPTHSESGEKLPGGVHMRVYTAFCDGEAATVRNLDVTAVKKIGLKLKMAHAHRVNSDYQLDRKVNRITALSVLKDAEEVESMVNHLLCSDDNTLSA